MKENRTNYERYFSDKLERFLAQNGLAEPRTFATRISGAAAVYTALQADAQPAAVAMDGALEVLYYGLAGNENII